MIALDGDVVIDGDVTRGNAASGQGIQFSTVPPAPYVEYRAGHGGDGGLAIVYGENIANDWASGSNPGTGDHIGGGQAGNGGHLLVTGTLLPDEVSPNHVVAVSGAGGAGGATIYPTFERALQVSTWLREFCFLDKPMPHPGDSGIIENLSGADAECEPGGHGGDASVAPGPNMHQLRHGRDGAPWAGEHGEDGVGEDKGPNVSAKAEDGDDGCPGGNGGNASASGWDGPRGGNGGWGSCGAATRDGGDGGMGGIGGTGGDSVAIGGSGGDSLRNMFGAFVDDGGNAGSAIAYAGNGGDGGNGGHAGGIDNLLSGNLGTPGDVGPGGAPGDRLARAGDVGQGINDGSPAGATEVDGADGNPGATTGNPGMVHTFLCPGLPPL